MLEALGHWIVKNRKATLAAYAVFVVAAFAGSAGLFGSLKTQGYDDPGSISASVDRLLISEFQFVEPSVVMIVDAPTSVDDPTIAASAEALVGSIQRETGVSRVVSYWTDGKPATMRSTDGRAALITVYFASTTTPEEASATAGRLQDSYDGKRQSLSVHVGGLQTIYHAINSRIKTDLTKAESIAIPLNILLLLVVFGTAIAAGLPMVVALAAISGSMLVLFAATQFTDVSVFAVNLVTGLGLGLGIDYALLVVNRFREELHAGHTVDDAVARTVASAGRTVVFSGAAVMLVLASMISFPQYFLKSFAYAGVSVVFFAVLGSLIALPAALAASGHRIDRYAIRKSAAVTKEDGAWAWLSRAVMKRPWPVIVATVAVLGAVASPAFTASFGQVDDRVLPAADRAATAAQLARDRFAGQGSTPIEILIPKRGNTATDVDRFAETISPLPGVVTIATPNRIWQGQWLVPQSPPANQESANHYRVTIVTDQGARDQASVDLVREIRGLSAPVGTMVGGASAIYVDSLGGISGNLGPVLGWLAVATLVILFLYTGSVLLPVKAVLLNVLSLGATLGIITWVFQEGNARSLVGDFTVTGTLDTSTIVLIAVVAFGLSMDYEVFMLSRIKEEHDRGASTVEAVSFGLQKSGRIITAAALLIAVVFLSFISSGVTSIKMLGLGTAVAILLDATVVRGLLVPALMNVAGSWNWWAPAWLRAIHGRVGLRE